MPRSIKQAWNTGKRKKKTTKQQQPSNDTSLKRKATEDADDKRQQKRRRISLQATEVEENAKPKSKSKDSKSKQRIKSTLPNNGTKSKYPKFLHGLSIYFAKTENYMREEFVDVIRRYGGSHTKYMSLNVYIFAYYVFFIFIGFLLYY